MGLTAGNAAGFWSGVINTGTEVVLVLPAVSVVSILPGPALRDGFSLVVGLRIVEEAAFAGGCSGSPKRRGTSYFSKPAVPVKRAEDNAPREAQDSSGWKTSVSMHRGVGTRPACWLNFPGSLVCPLSVFWRLVAWAALAFVPSCFRGGVPVACLWLSLWVWAWLLVVSVSVASGPVSFGGVQLLMKKGHRPKNRQ